MAGGVHGRGHVLQGVCIAGGHVWWGACMAGGMCGRENGNCSRRYTSYWNAFLLTRSLEILTTRGEKDNLTHYFNQLHVVYTR